MFKAQDLQRVVPVSTSLSAWFRRSWVWQAELCLDKHRAPRCQLQRAKHRGRGRSGAASSRAAAGVATTAANQGDRGALEWEQPSHQRQLLILRTSAASRARRSKVEVVARWVWVSPPRQQVTEGENTASKLHQGRPRLDIRRNFSMESVVRHWKVSQEWLDVALGALGWFTECGSVPGLTWWSQRSIPT